MLNESELDYRMEQQRQAWEAGGPGDIPEAGKPKMELLIMGTPIAKKRPRFFRRGKGVGTYNSQETEEGKWLLLARRNITQMLTGPVAMTCKFLFPRPKSHFGTGKNAQKLKPSAPAYHIQTPDIDNLQKFVKDCLNGVAYRDDSQIVQVEAEKGWAEWFEQPRTEIKLWEV